MDKYNELQAIVLLLKNDIIKNLEKDNHAAGVRLRKNLKQITILAQEIRKETLNKPE